MNSSYDAHYDYLQCQEAEIKQLREQLRLANIDAVQNEAEANELRELNAELLLQLKRLMLSTNWSEICEETESSIALIAKAEALK